ncbi:MULTISPECIES: aromatic ring-hydroxylating dioxygenase subunit alpha [Nostoc]|uniref:Aromatic ring-hydroxylating dioxygenase subunit alpha n=1 Tax=Nostoc paludosum FACHB-159 TaxID=2692908 RepID=A0ABR8KG23_9NOSO|nr:MULTISPECIES: aromatic ring-hydroxylating dioxygenase subunit alpha [Nostoc]MBD2682173.1 aromatic ring-hydroxylating dioxygenase subunit alpha [Nostoc sp. FACHB-857]MBD2738501.1 aromatic ring-hydroxylating dioxygenase subunit alpha [Nostoc paludosum FACHB-159]
MVNDVTLKNDWHVVAKSEDVTPGKVLSVRLLGEDLVVWRSGDQVLAWEDRCPHRGASFAQGWIKDDNLVCPYHGFAFNNSGNCVHVPAHPDWIPSTRSRACVQTFHVQERYGLVWVCLGTPQYELPAIPELDDPSYYKCFFGPIHYHSSAFRAIENFLDFNHIPFVHDGRLGESNHATIDDYKVKVNSDGIHVTDLSVWQLNHETGQGEYVSASYDIFRPLTVCLRVRSKVVDEIMTMFFTVTPVEEEKSIVWRWSCINYADKVPEDVFRNLAHIVFDQDVAIVESQRPRRIPLDLEANFHVPSDRSSITYRRWLKQQGVTFGTV